MGVTRRREGAKARRFSIAVRAELVEAPFFLARQKKRAALRQAQGARSVVLFASSRETIPRASAAWCHRPPPPHPRYYARGDRKRDGLGQRVSVRVDSGGGRHQ